MLPLQWWAESAPPGCNRVKISQNFGATTVAPVAPVDTSLILLAGISIYTFWQFLVLSSVYIGQCTHLTVIHFFSTVRCVHWIMYTLDSNKIDFTVCSDITGWRLTGAIADLFFTKYNGNILGVTRVHWRIYSLGVEQYIPRRFAPLDILHNPSGVYSPMYPCHAHYIITIKAS